MSKPSSCHEAAVPLPCSTSTNASNAYVDNANKTEQDLRESERQLATLLANLPGLAYRCLNDFDWTMLFISGGCLELTGYHPQDLLERRISYNDLIDEPYRQYLWSKWQRVLPAGEVFTEEYTITTAWGEQKWVWEQGRGVYGPDGEVIAIEGIVMDISDRKWAEETARQRLTELVHMSYHDKLTGLYNRAFLEQEMERLNTSALLPITVIIGDINGLKVVNDVFGHLEGDKLLVSISQVLRDACHPDCVVARWGGDEFVILLPATDEAEAEALCTRLDEQVSSLPNEFVIPSISLGYAAKNDQQTSLQQALVMAEDRMLRRKLLENKSMRSAIMDSLQETLYRKSSETEEHGRRIAELCHKMSHVLKLPRRQHDEIRLLAILHDIGKIGVRDSILQKPGSLTDEEWMEMKRHPEMGYHIAHAIYELAPIAKYILTHHERWDGNGYPQGIKGEEIPFLSRMLAVADAYDAMTQPRPYRKAMGHEEAVAEIVRCRGTQFDPNIVDVFLQIIVD